jgi:hypothetical protein
VPAPAGLNVVASVFYSGQSGRPWSALYGLDYNGDARTTNDLLYIPASANEDIVYTAGTFADLMTFVNGEKCLSDNIGKIQERNACRSPWTNTLDFRLNVGLPFKRVKAEITWDVLNLINLFDRQKGLFQYANFNDLLVVRPTVGSLGTVTYDLRNIVINGVAQTPSQQLTRDDLRSRWQMQLGGRLRF